MKYANLVRIDVGCGRKPKDGYIGIDIRKNIDAHLTGKIDSLPFHDGKVDEIYSRHALEHIPLKRILEALRDWNRVLKTGGRVHIIVPNLLFHAKQLLEGSHASIYSHMPGKRNARRWAYGSIFGWNQNRYDHHYFGFYYELLRDLLEANGFGEIKNLTGRKNGEGKHRWHLEVSAIKVCSPKDDARIINIFGGTSH
jgi:predicted SAM-dependent methyltransferase